MIQFKRLQHGSMTIMTSVAVLMLVTMVTVMNANVSVMETKTSSNEYRTLQALLSAQAGIDFALSSLSKNNFANIPETELTYDDDGTAITTGFYSVAVDATDINKLIITSTGQSADKTATKILTQRLIFSTVLRNDATRYLNAPLITSGNADIDHRIISVGVAPNESPARVWSGGTISVQSQSDLGGNGADPTELRKLASKLYEKDPLTNSPLNVLFSPQMRANNNQAIKHMSIYHDCADVICTNPSKLTENAGRSKVHYVQGGLVLDGVTVGTQENPVFIIVDLSDGGSLTLKNDAVVNGILLTLGNVDNNDRDATINGIFIVDGNLVDGVDLTLNFDINVMNSMSTVGVYTRIPGSWTDS